MPRVYDYVCENPSCGHKFEELTLGDDDVIVCPECNGCRCQKATVCAPNIKTGSKTKITFTRPPIELNGKEIPKVTIKTGDGTEIPANLYRLAGDDSEVTPENTAILITNTHPSEIEGKTFEVTPGVVKITTPDGKSSVVPAAELTPTEEGSSEKKTFTNKKEILKTTAPSIKVALFLYKK